VRHRKKEGAIDQVEMQCERGSVLQWVSIPVILCSQIKRNKLEMSGRSRSGGLGGKYEPVRERRGMKLLVLCRRHAGENLMGES